MSANIRIEPVTDKKGILEYVKYPFRLYHGDPNWVPPLIEERRDFFDPRKTPFTNTPGTSSSWPGARASWSARSARW